MKLFCTYFDSGYLSRGLALIASLRASGELSKVLVVAFDDVAYKYLDARKSELGLLVRKSEDLLAKYPELAKVKDQRTYSELFFTSSPFLVKLALEEVDEGDLVIYLDADLFFFENPQPIFEELSEGSIGIISHNYPNKLRRLAGKYGTFNVGLVIFRNDIEGRRVVEWWAKRCIEWCHDFPQDGKYADQGYLNSFPELSSETVILQNPGLNLAPWNTSSSTLVSEHQKISVNNQPLLFFHFHGLSRMAHRYASAQLTYRSVLSRSVFKAIYEPYVKILVEIEEKLQEAGLDSHKISKRGVGLRGILFVAYKRVLNWLSIMMGQTVSVPKSR